MVARNAGTADGWLLRGLFVVTMALFGGGGGLRTAGAGARQCPVVRNLKSRKKYMNHFNYQSSNEFSEIKTCSISEISNF